MSNVCRSFKEPCTYARSRFGRQMSNSATMPETWGPAEMPNPCRYSNNYRRTPVKERRSCGGQIPGKELLLEQLLQEYQKYGNYGNQQVNWSYWEPYRYNGGQPSIPPQGFYGQQPPQTTQRCNKQQPAPHPERYHCQSTPLPQRFFGQQPPPPTPQRCCGQQLSPPPQTSNEQQQPAPLPQRFCQQQCPPPQCPKRCNDQQPAPSERYCCEEKPICTCQDQESSASDCRSRKRRRRRSCRPRRCCSSESVCVKTCEEGVQTIEPRTWCCQAEPRCDSPCRDKQRCSWSKKCSSCESVCVKTCEAGFQTTDPMKPCGQEEPRWNSPCRGQIRCCWPNKCCSCESVCAKSCEEGVQTVEPLRSCCQKKPICNSPCLDKLPCRGRSCLPKKCCSSESVHVVTHEEGVQTACEPCCCRKKKQCCCCCECPCLVTHEVSVQTEPPADKIEIVDVVTQEKKITHRTGEVEFIVDEVQTVTVVPGDGSKATKSQSESRTVSNSENPQRVETQFKEEIDPTSIKVPTGAMDYSELETIMENLKDIPTAPPSGASSPTDSKERRVYRTNALYEQDYKQNTGKNETQTFLADPKIVRHAAGTRNVAASSPPYKWSSPKRSPKTRSPIKEVWSPKQKKPVTRIYSPIRRPDSGYSGNMKDESSKPVVTKHINWDPEETTFPKTQNKADEELAPKPLASDFNNMSTIHINVTNRREQFSQKAGRKSVHQDAVFQTRVSELLVMTPSPESEEESPEPEKQKCRIRTDMKHPYPSKDVVCRRKKCREQIGGVPCGAEYAAGCGVPCRAGYGACCGAGWGLGWRRKKCYEPICAVPCGAKCGAGYEAGYETEYRAGCGKGHGAGCGKGHGAGCGAGCRTGHGAERRSCCLPCNDPCSRSRYPPCMPPKVTRCDSCNRFSY